VGPGGLFIGMVAAGVAVAVISLLALRASSASPGVARRLAGPAEWKVGRLLGDEPLPSRPIRVVGRIRCRDPLDAGDGERLVAFHRDVEVRLGGRWRSVERMRETRSFELWDHDGSLTMDPALAAEPLITIPQVWRGTASELSEPHASAAARLAERHDAAATEARATTRSINVTDRLLVVARASRDPSGAVRLDPPDGGYLISTVALEDAMRLLGGTNRRAAAGGVVGLALAIGLLAIGGIGAFMTAVLR
jgi:hypothetical protein